MKDILDNETLQKYRFAGKIRFLSFTLLLIFILALKLSGACRDINMALVSLIFVEAVINQPYRWLVRRVDLTRFQYYQITTDIIAITWVLYYLGGLDAPVISIAYYVLILWAGVVSGTAAVIFTVTASSLLFSCVMCLEHFGMIPFSSYYNLKMPTSQMISQVLGNVSFMFAFGYFSAYSAAIVKEMDRTRQEDTLRNTHRLTATGHLVSGLAHDLLNNLASIKGYAQFLLTKEDRDASEREMLSSVDRIANNSSAILSKLANFSRKSGSEIDLLDINKTIEDTIELVSPLIKTTKMKISKYYEEKLPGVYVCKDQLQDVFMVIILNAFDATSKEGELIIKTVYDQRDNIVDIVFSDNGVGIKKEYLKRMGEPFFSTKKEELRGTGLGLTTAYDIIAKHNGRIIVDSVEGKGASFVVELPAVPPEGSI